MSIYGAMTGAPRGPGVRRVGASPYVGGSSGPEESLGVLPPDPELDFTPKPPPQQGPPPGYWEDTPPAKDFAIPEPEPEPEPDPMIPKSYPKFAGKYPVFKQEPGKMVDVPASMGKPGKISVGWDMLKGEYGGPYADLPAIGYNYEPSWGAGGVPTASIDGYTSYDDIWGDYYGSDAYKSWVTDLAYRAGAGPGVTSGLTKEYYDLIWPALKDLSEYTTAARLDPGYIDAIKKSGTLAIYPKPFAGGKYMGSPMPEGWKPVSGYY